MSYAEDDLRTAEALSGEVDVPRQVCFHAQQAAEKAIKSIFVFLQTEFPYTHDLDCLLGLLPEGWPIKDEFADLSGLTFWATRGRYPGSPREATDEEADAAVKLARKVFETALKDLEDHGYDQKEEREEPDGKDE